MRYQGAVVVAIPAACLLITLGSWVWSREALLAIRRNIESVQETIAASETILVQNVNAETGVRSYIITRNPSFLEPYRFAQAQIASRLQTLEQKLSQQPNPPVALQSIKQLTQQNMAVSQQAVEIASAQAANSPTAELNRVVYESKATMDALRQSVAEFQAKERQILDQYIQQRTQVQDATAAALWFTGIISALGSWAAIYLFIQVDKDLSDREHRLRESKSLLHAITASVVDGVITVDEQGNIDIFNPTASTMFGYAPREVVGKNLDLLLAETDLEHIEKHLETAIQTRGTWETVGLRSDGSTFPISVSISDVRLDDHRLIAIVRDMSEVQQTQEKLESRANELARLSAILAQTNTVLEDRNRELEQFAYVASHDLKAPLRAIAHLSEWIEEDLQGDLPPENQKQMQLLRGRVHRMEALINGLLEYSRIGRVKTSIETISLTKLLAEIVDSLAPPSTFAIHISPELPTFKAKVLPLRQVFANLIGNAIKHHDKDAGHIQISVKDLGTFYEFAVADDGPGIHPDFHQKIFTIFQTLQARDTKESTGIGLSIVKKIVETEGGTIRVESQEGQGSTFYFTWLKTPFVDG
ncbi:MAG: CHASE3 domain-containing protein [Oscillatoriales cyanobacterium C42_A2020_001]|nr:CHASE3 domain-containing protein [Leptolyngbyaceae cyanobacterium C42_A2020_001]